MTRQFDERTLREFEDLLTRYPTRRAALLPTLRLVEREFGDIGTADMKYVAGLLDLSPAMVLGVVTFYTHYRRSGCGKHRLMVCRTLPCALRGAGRLYDHLAATLDLGHGQTTDDGLFTLEKVECLGACDQAPVLQVDDDYHDRMTPEAVDELLGQLRAEVTP